jgi:hypothetical protein
MYTRYPDIPIFQLRIVDGGPPTAAAIYPQQQQQAAHPSQTSLLTPVQFN